MREPTYHKQNQNYRVASVGNGLWVAQVHRNVRADRVTDPWENLHSPRAYDAAVAVMYDRAPLKGA